MSRLATLAGSLVLLIILAGCESKEFRFEASDPASWTPEQQEQARKVEEAMQRPFGEGAIVLPGLPGAPPPVPATGGAPAPASP